MGLPDYLYGGTTPSTTPTTPPTSSSGSATRGGLPNWLYATPAATTTTMPTTTASTSTSVTDPNAEARRLREERARELAAAGAVPTTAVNDATGARPVRWTDRVDRAGTAILSNLSGPVDVASTLSDLANASPAVASMLPGGEPMMRAFGTATDVAKRGLQAAEDVTDLPFTGKSQQRHREWYRELEKPFNADVAAQLQAAGIPMSQEQGEALGDTALEATSLLVPTGIPAAGAARSVEAGVEAGAKAGAKFAPEVLSAVERAAPQVERRAAPALRAEVDAILPTLAGKSRDELASIAKTAQPGSALDIAVERAALGHENAMTEANALDAARNRTSSQTPGTARATLRDVNVESSPLASTSHVTPTPIGEPPVNTSVTTATPRASVEADLTKAAVEPTTIETPTGIANVHTQAQRDERGLPAVEVPESQLRGGDEAVLAAGRKLVDDNVIDPRALARNLAEKPRSLSGEEIGVLLYDRTRLKNEYRATLDEADKAFASGDEAAGIKAKERLAEIEDARNDNEVASKRTGYEWSVSGHAMQQLMADDYSAAGLMQQARVYGNGKPVDDATRTTLTTLSRQLEEANAKIAAADEARSAQHFDTNFVARERRHAAHAVRKAGRAATREQLDAEFADLSQQFRKTMSTPRAGLDPEQVATMVKMARNRVHAGVTSAADIVDAVYLVARDHIEGLTQRQVRDAISGYGKPPSPPRDQLVGALREAKREMYLITKLEDARAGHVLPGATRLRRPKSQAIAKLEQQITEAMDAAGIAKGPDEAARLKAFRARNTNIITSLEEQIRTGKFEPSRRPQALSLSREDLDQRTHARLLRDQIKRELELHRVAHMTPQERLTEVIKATAGGIRSGLSGPDLSWPFRQGIGAVAWPKQFGRSFVNMHGYAFSEGTYQRMISRIEADPDYLFSRRVGLDLTAIDSGKATAREEQLVRKELPEAIPLIGKLYKGSNRAFAGMATDLRFSLFKHMTAMAQLGGVDFATAEGAKRAANLAKVINTLTGRGSLGSLEKVAGELSTAFWSPRLMSSRVHMLTNPFDPRLDAFARWQAARGLLGVAAFTGTAAALARAAGFKVGYDVRSPDFGKIIIGKTRIDLGGGLFQFIRFGGQFTTGEAVNSETGEVYDLTSGEYGKPTRLSATYRFGEGKTNPYVAVVLNWLRARTLSGEKTTWKTQARAMMPLPVQNAYETATSSDASLLPMTMLLSNYGAGVQTYGERKKREYANKRSDNGDDDETFIDKVANW